MVDEDSQRDQKLERAASLGIDLFGAATGAAIGAAGGPITAVIGALAGTTIANVGRDVVGRLLSPRQEARAGYLFVEAGAIIKAKEITGGSVRDDGFWEGDHSTGSEFAEGVLLAAVDAYEEGKLPYLAKLLANVATDARIPAASANYALSMAKMLTWTELQVLGVFWAAEQGKYKLPDHPKSHVSNSWYHATIHQTYVDLSDRYKLIHAPKGEPTDKLGLRRYNLNLSAVVLPNPGRLVAGLMELDTIPQPDLVPIIESLSLSLPTEEASD